MVRLTVAAVLTFALSAHAVVDPTGAANVGNGLGKQGCGFSSAGAGGVDVQNGQDGRNGGQCDQNSVLLGQNGQDGQDGQDGGLPGLPGKDGQDGQDGGLPGLPGKDGQDGGLGGQNGGNANGVKRKFARKFIA